MLQGKLRSPKPIKIFVIRSELMRIRESQLAIGALVETQGQLLVEQMARLNQLEERLNNTITNSNITVAQNISSSSNSSLPIQNSTIALSPTPSLASSNSMARSSTGGDQASITPGT